MPELGRDSFPLDPTDPLDVRRDALVEECIQLACSHDPELHAGSESCGLENRAEPVVWDELAVIQAIERGAGCAARLKERLPGSQEARHDPLPRHSGEGRDEVGVGFGFRDDEVRQAEGVAVERLQQPGERRARPPAATVEHDRVVERRRRIEDERTLAGDPASERHVELPRVADDHDVEVDLRATQQAEARLWRAGSPNPLPPRTCGAGAPTRKRATRRPRRRHVSGTR